VDASLVRQVEQGRGGHAFFGDLIGGADALRARVAGLVGCQPRELALTGSTTDGVNSVLGGLDLGPGDEVLTSFEEHPGLLVPLAVGAKRYGYSIRQAPFAELAGHVGSAKLVACSHVSWITGAVADTEALAATDALVLLDGAQGLGAVPVDVRALGCDFYAASGQKWLCGPVGSGYLYVKAERLDDITPPWPGFGTVADPERALDLQLRAESARLDPGLRPAEHTAWANASLDVLEAAGFDDVLATAADGAERLAERLRESGLKVAARGRTTLVSWEEREPEAVAERLKGSGVVVRHLPGWPYVRASVGGWTSEDDVERLLRALA
jgi:L-cysteine/cystine lyase